MNTLNLLTVLMVSLLSLEISPAWAGAATDAPLLANGDFEQGNLEWNDLWARETGVAHASLDTTVYHGGRQSLRIDNTGEKDWSLGHSQRVDVKPGDIFEYSAWVRSQGIGIAALSVITRDSAGKTINWVYGLKTTHETKGWQFLSTRFIIPAGIASIQPRLTGDNPATVWCDDFTLTRQGDMASLQNKSLPAELHLRNDSLDITFHTADATLSVQDHRINRMWKQQMVEVSAIVLSARASGRTLTLKLLDPMSLREIQATVELERRRPELVITLHAKGFMQVPFAWPAPFQSTEGQLLILPVNEGISYPVDDASLTPMRYHLYGGHGLCMPWYGAMDGSAGWMAIVETPDDASVAIPRHEERLVLAPEWEASKREFGPDRIIRYAFLDSGGYVAMANRYRNYAKKTGLLKTLAEKRKAVPAVDQLVGAVNIWCWDRDATTWCRELQALGIKRILWSNALAPDQIRALNDLGVLTSRYDIYQDAMNPVHFPKLRWVSPDWTSGAWTNDDLIIGADGDWVRGWQVEVKEGPMIPCGTLCDRQALPYARQRIPSDLATHPYHCRFIDTTTASSWRECYHPKHPMTRTDCKHFRMNLLQYISEGCGLVCGSETGHDAAVPFVHYFEGMLSLAPYRVPESGREMMKIWNEVPEPVAKFQTGHTYRLPLWELVYHDCVVAQWYWGDYNNKLPTLWDRRDLWNALYGTPPMFMFDRTIWKANKDRFVKSYKTTAVARATGYSRMLSHEWLTPDRAVQRTRFENGVEVTANFGNTPFALPDGPPLPPLEYRVAGMKAE